MVFELCRKDQVEDKSLVELLKESEEIKKAGLPGEELEKLCDPGNYLGLSEVMVEMVSRDSR
jgi:3-carboxy-cis,cis-muconate cycloisomerase